MHEAAARQQIDEDAARERMREIAGGITARTFTAIHIDRPANDHPANPFCRAEGKHVFGIGGKFASPQDLQRAGHCKVAILAGAARTFA